MIGTHIVKMYLVASARTARRSERSTARPRATPSHSRAGTRARGNSRDVSHAETLCGPREPVEAFVGGEVDVFAVLQHRAEGRARRRRRRCGRRRAGAARRPSRSSPRRPAASARRACARAAPRRRPARRGSADASGTRRRTMRDRLLQRRVVDPVVEAAALERVVQVARAVRRQHDDRRAATRGACRARGS